MDFDVGLARRDTPGAEKVAHLNNAGAALPPVQVTDAVVAHLRRESEMGGYEAAAAARDQVERTYSAIADLIGAKSDEIAVVENATRGGTWHSTGWPSPLVTASSRHEPNTPAT